MRKAIREGTRNQQGKKRGPWSLQQMATCAGRKKKKRWCVVFSCMRVCPPLSAALLLQGGIYWPGLLSVFSLCVFMWEKTDLGLSSPETSLLQCALLSENKRCFRESPVLLQVSSIFITFGSVLVFLLSSQMRFVRSFVADQYSHVIWFHLVFCELKKKKTNFYAIVLWNLGLGAGWSFLVMQSYLSCRRILRRITWGWGVRC